jgi:transposase
VWPRRLPLDFVLTGAEASDTRQFETLLELGPDATPRAVIADKSYDAKVNRDAASKRGSLPLIPRRKNAKDRGRFFPKRLYKLRARIEQLNGKAKRFKRLAMRCEKTARSYSAIVSLVFMFIWIKSVHAA